MSFVATVEPLRWVPGLYSGLYLLIALFLFALLWWLPRLGRDDVFFAVTVEPGFRDGEVGKAALSRYRRWVESSSVAVILGMLAAGLWGASPRAFWVLPGLLTVQILGFVVGYFVARRHVLPASVARTSATEGETRWTRDRLPGGPLIQAGPWLILAAAGLWLWLGWQSIPARYPVHWNAALEADGWVTRSPGKVMGPLLVGTLMTVAMWLIQWGMLRFTRQVHSHGETAAAEVVRRRRTAEVVLLGTYDMALVFALVAVGPLFQTSAAASKAWLACLLTLSFLGTAVILVWIAVRMVPAYRLATVAEGGREPPPGDGTADARWKGGLIYYAPDDPAIFIEKRFGLGYTVNMARPSVWLVLLLLLVAPFLLLAF